jgi:riboflavin synthase
MERRDSIARSTGSAPRRKRLFSGIVEGMATVAAARRSGAGLRLALDARDLASGVKTGESIAVDGTCLTVAVRQGRRLEFDVVAETLSRTTLGGLRPGAKVNVERSLRLSDRVGGHLVTGHVDGVGRIAKFDRRPGQAWLEILVAPELASTMLFKGSITLAGVSLTIASLADDRVAVALVPHTLRVTTLGSWAVGDPVNVETDLLGKWVRRLLEESGSLPARRVVRRSRTAPK